MSKDLNRSLRELFDLPKVSNATTAGFKQVSHEELLNYLQIWIRYNCHLLESNINIVDIQGIHDKGIDLITTVIKNNESSRVGIQVKCDNDLKIKLEPQIDKTLANYALFNLDLLIIIFCVDRTNLSHLTKERMEVSRISQRPGNILLVDAAHAYSIFSEQNIFQPYFDQFTGRNILSARVLDIQQHKSGFPYFSVEYSSEYPLSDDISSLIKAYLLCIIPIVGTGITSFSPKLAPFAIGFKDKELIFPQTYLRGLEEHGFINLWGNTASREVGLFQVFIQFFGTRREFESNNHYKLVENKFLILATRLEKLGLIEIKIPAFKKAPTKKDNIA